MSKYTGSHRENLHDIESWAAMSDESRALANILLESLNDLAEFMSRTVVANIGTITFDYLHEGSNATCQSLPPGETDSKFRVGTDCLSILKLWHDFLHSVRADGPVVISGDDERPDSPPRLGLPGPLPPLEEGLIMALAKLSVLIEDVSTVVNNSLISADLLEAMFAVPSRKE